MLRRRLIIGGRSWRRPGFCANASALENAGVPPTMKLASFRRRDEGAAAEHAALIYPADGRPIELPNGLSRQIDYEAELAVVIGRSGRAIAPARAFDHVWATPSSTTSPPATCSSATSNGSSPNRSTASARWGRGWSAPT